MAKKKTSSSQGTLAFGGPRKKQISVKGYSRSFSASKLPPRAKNGKFKKR
jgi:hypothetical protein